MAKSKKKVRKKTSAKDNYRDSAVRRIKKALKGPFYPVCCRKFPSCHCPGPDLRA